MIAPVGWLTVFTVAAATITSAAQSSQTPDASETRVASLSRGWSALASGRAAEAEQIAAALVARRPSDHAALLLQIEAQTALLPATALDTYSAWAKRVGADDVFLLAVVARGILRAVAEGPRTPDRLAAVQALAEDGDDQARTALNGMAGSQPAAAVAIAANGDAQARRAALAALTGSGLREKSAAIDDLSRGGVDIPPAVLEPLLSDSSPETRAAAARAAGRSDARTLVPQLERLLRDPDPMVANSAALALHRLGSTAGADTVKTMLESDVPGVRLTALDVLRDDPGVSVSAVAGPLLQDEDPLVQVQAAALVALSDPASASTVLLEKAGSDNPAVAGEAARALASAHIVVQPGSLTDLLRSPVPAVRVAGARTVLQQARRGLIGPASP